MYDAWGTLRSTAGSATSRLGYTGELQDGSLVYLRARWYHTGLGTFTSRDTYAGTPDRPQSLHRYGYTEGNPVNYSDPSGMCRPEQLGWFGEQGCTWFWETPQGFDPLQAKQDYVNWYWHIFQNIGLPGAIAGDIINTLSGNPTNMAEEIIQQDALAAVIGGLGRDFATGGTGRLPQLGTFIAGWSYAKGVQRIICGKPVDPLGFAANTLVLVVGIKGGPTTINVPSIPLGVKTVLQPNGTMAFNVIATQAYAISIPTAQLAGAVAGQPGVLVLMADDGAKAGGGGPSAYEQAKQHVRSNGKLFRAGMMRHPPGQPNDLQISTGQKFNTKPNTKYLWVIDDQGNLRIAQEASTQNLPTWSGIKHPQLVNEGKVYGAGEVWFNADDTIRLNTESGRYMGRQSATDNQQALAFAQMLFKALGYSP